MDHGLQTPATLVAAPAGYGKSVLVSHWAESLEGPCAWVSLDEGDSDLGLFLKYVVAAVQKAVPEACEETDALLQAGDPPPIPVLARTLANELDALDAPFVLVLDDYHQIAQDSEVHRLLDRLLQHPPEPLRLVFTTRRDPPLSLMALRAAGRLTEVRLQDLRFTAPEAAELLASMGDLTVGAEALDRVQQEVEGWAVGLRLLALALRHVEDPDGFLRQLRGGLPNTEEYLVREVLAAQSPEVRERMLEASILERFCPAVLDALPASKGAPVPSGPSGRDLVSLLQERHLFTVPLDARGEWHRYHHLFRDLLLGLLRERASAEEVAALRSRASEWFESQGLIGESIRYALAAGSGERAAEIVERRRVEELAADRWHVVEQWLALLPATVRQQRPGILLTEACVDYCRFRIDRIAGIVETVGPLLEGREVEASLEGELAFYRGMLEYWMGEGERSRQLLEDALPGLIGRHPYIEPEAELTLALARAMVGRGDGAIRALQDRIQRTGPSEIMMLSRLIGGLLFIDLLSGDLTPARAEAQRMEDVANRGQLRNTLAWARYLQACTHLQALDLTAAADLFARAAESRHLLEPRTATDALAGLALTRQLLGQADDAAEAVERLEEFARERNDPVCDAVAQSSRSRLGLLRGDPAPPSDRSEPARDGLTPGDLFVWLEVPALTATRALIATGSAESLGEASERLEAIRQASESWHFTNQAIEVAVLQSLVLQKQGRAAAATGALEEAVALARPGGWIRPFVEAGPVIAEMLERRHEEADEEGFVGRVLAAFEGAGAAAPAGGSRGEGAGPLRAGEQPSPEVLTNRELDILELLAQRLQDKEIADRLVIAAPTVNYHLKRLYRKLGVHGRRQAVDHARGRGILKAPVSG